MNTRVFRTIASLASILVLGQVQAQEIFAPDSCDFSVTFPGTFSTRLIFDSNGNNTTQAKWKGRRGNVFGAECWPRTLIDIEDFAERLGEEMTSRGATVSNVLLEADSTIPKTIATGTMVVADTNLYIQMVSYFGQSARLDLFIIQRLPYSAEALAFRNSVRIFDK